MKEIEIIKYEAFDGEVFDDRDDCLNYERNNAETRFYGFKCYNTNGARITLKDLSPVLDHTAFITVEEVNTFRDFLEYYDETFGLFCCYEDYGISNFTAGHYYYDEDNDRFIKVEDEIAKWQNVLENFPKD